jgi:hypothetical protein
VNKEEVEVALLSQSLFLCLHLYCSALPNKKTDYVGLFFVASKLKGLEPKVGKKR